MLAYFVEALLSICDKFFARKNEPVFRLSSQRRLYIPNLPNVVALQAAVCYIRFCDDSSSNNTINEKNGLWHGGYNNVSSP